MDKVPTWLHDHQGELLALLERLVNIDSGSYCKGGIDRCGEIHAAELRALGFTTRTIAETERGNHVVAERAGRGQHRLFLSGHLDTVCPEGSGAQRPFRIAGRLAPWPGDRDIQGRIVQTTLALRAVLAL